MVLNFDPEKAARVLVGYMNGAEFQTLMESTGSAIKDQGQGARRAFEGIGSAGDGLGTLALGGAKALETAATGSLIGAGVSAGKTALDALRSWQEGNQRRLKEEAAAEEASRRAQRQGIQEHIATAPARIMQREETADREAGKISRMAISELRPFTDKLYIHAAHRHEIPLPTPPTPAPAPRQKFYTRIFWEAIRLFVLIIFGFWPDLDHPAVLRDDVEPVPLVAQGEDGAVPDATGEEGEVAITIVYVTQSACFRLALEENAAAWDGDSNFHIGPVAFERLEEAIRHLAELAAAARRYRTTVEDNKAHERITPPPRTQYTTNSFIPLLGRDIARLAAVSRRQYRIILCDPTNGIDNLETPHEHNFSGVPSELINDDPFTPVSLVIVGEAEDDKPRHALRFYGATDTAADREVCYLPEYILGYQRPGIFRQVALHTRVREDGDVAFFYSRHGRGTRTYFIIPYGAAAEAIVPPPLVAAAQQTANQVEAPVAGQGAGQGP